ncbi:MAG: LysR family transcriptional regulator [Burkholderiaceae bacterium]|nr:LysR family transcriptional regulator [Burkholderiaceae bacterium]
MRLTQLRSFNAVARTGSFTAAAKFLHVSQPTVTTQVRALEDTYNVELFLRHGRKVHLTPLGEQLMLLSQHIFSLHDDATDLLNDAGKLRSGHLRVAAVGPSHVTKMLVDFNRKYPGVKISVSTGNSQGILNNLLEYQADVGVLARFTGDDRFLSIPFNPSPIVICTSIHHPFAKLASISIADLHNERFILREQGSTTRKVLEQAFATAKISPQIVMEISSREVIREAVVQGLGIAAVSRLEYVPSPKLHMVKIRDVAIYTYAHAVCLAERQNARIVHAFFATLAQETTRKSLA